VVYSLEYLFAIMAVCQKGTMPINAGDQTETPKNAKVQMQQKSTKSIQYSYKHSYYWHFTNPVHKCRYTEI